MEALAAAQALLEDQQNVSVGDKARLLGYLEGSGRMILPEPQPLLTPMSKMPGLDGQKMSKSYNNVIELREDPASVKDKIKRMPTDPARVRRTDPGDPKKCPVWQWHKIYSDDETREWVKEGCRSADIGCIQCKEPVIEAVLAEQAPFRERALEYVDNPNMVRAIIADGVERAQQEAEATLKEVRHVMGLNYLR